VTEFPHDAVAELRERPGVATRRRWVHVDDADWPADPTEGWVGAGAVVAHPTASAVALVRNEWSGDVWLPPGGAWEPGDDSVAATAGREAEEETGLPVNVARPLIVERQRLVRADDPERSFDGWYVLFTAAAEDDTLGADPGVHADEIRAVEWFRELPDRVRFDGALRDALAD